VSGEATALEPDRAEWPSAFPAWWAVAVFTLCAVLSYTDRQILSLLVDPIRADLHITDTQISVLQGLAFALIYSIAGLPLGRLADMVPRRAVIICGVLVWTIATIACGLSHSFNELFVARVFVGVGEAALAPAAMSMITDLFAPHRRGGAIGVFVMGMVVGGGVALGIGGLLLQAAQSGLMRGLPLLGALTPWRASLLLLGAPGIGLALLLLTVREPARQHRGGGTTPQRYSLHEVGRELRDRSGVVFPLLGAMAFMSVGDFSLLNWVPSLLSRDYHLSFAEIGGTLGGLAIGMGGLGTVLGGLISDRAARSGGSRMRIIAAALSAMLALPLILIGATSNALEIFVLFAWWNCFSSAAGTIGITAIQETVPNEMRGLTVSMVSFGNILGGLSLGTMATAIVTDSVFHDPHRIAASLSLVVGPAAILGCLLFWRASLGAAPRRRAVPVTTAGSA